MVNGKAVVTMPILRCADSNTQETRDFFPPAQAVASVLRGRAVRLLWCKHDLLTPASKRE
jgi:hypothetical protein